MSVASGIHSPDATSVRRADRRPYLASARRHGLPAIAIVFDLPAGVVHARNAGRRRIVDPAVVDRHLAAVAMSADEDRLREEGFAAVTILHTPAEVDAMVVVRG